jgi:hypothetical protein
LTFEVGCVILIKTGVQIKRKGRYMAYTALNICVDDDVTETREFNDVTLAALAESEEIILLGRRRFKNSTEMLKELKNDVDA